MPVTGGLLPGSRQSFILGAACIPRLGKVVGVNAAYVKARYPITAEDWTAIIPAHDANYFGLKNADGSALILRTDKDDDQTEDTLTSSEQELVTAGINLTYLSGGAPRFPAGSTAVWVKATTGVGPVIVTWVL
jgi:hypothetical protein